MTDEVYRAFQNAVQRRKQPKVELLIDGHTGFLFLDKDGKPKVAMHLEHVMKRIVDRYNDAHEDKLPSITPHVLRHQYVKPKAKTFSENNAVLDAKSRTQLNAQDFHNIRIHAQVNLAITY